MVKKITIVTLVVRHFLYQKICFVCDYCGKLFSSERNLKMHCNSVHESSEDQKCDSCGKVFFSSSMLFMKVKDISIVIYVEKSVLNKHIYIFHAGYKDYKYESISENMSAVQNYEFISFFNKKKFLEYF